MSATIISKQIKNELRGKGSDLDMTADLYSLVVDSLDLVELMVRLQQDFKIHLEHADFLSIAKVGDLVGLIAHKKQLTV